MFAEKMAENLTDKLRLHKLRPDPWMMTTT